jgi:uncharacterized protein
MERTLFIVPRWGGKPESDFYPWLQSELAQPPALFSRVQPLAMPVPGAPVPAAWVGALAEAVGPQPAPGTVLMGHSVGCQAVLRYLASLPAGKAVEGALLVAAWWSVDRPWESILPWQDLAGVDLERVRSAAWRLVVLLSDNDPFTAGHQENGRLWQERLGAQVVLVPGARHFNESPQPAVLEALRTHFG